MKILTGKKQDNIAYLILELQKEINREEEMNYYMASSLLYKIADITLNSEYKLAIYETLLKKEELK